MVRLIARERREESRPEEWPIEQDVHRSHDEVEGVVDVVPRGKTFAMDLRLTDLDLRCVGLKAGSCA